MIKIPTYQEWQQQQGGNVAQTPQASSNNTSNTITGHTLEEHQRALQAARAAGNKTAEADILNNYTTEYQYQKDAGKIGGQQTADQQKSEEYKKKIAGAAENLLKILDAKKSGKLTGKAYEDALNYASAEAAKQAFGEGGKQLSETEQALIQGTIPRIEIKAPNAYQRIVGEKPTQTGKVIDPEDTLRRKALLLLDYASGKPVNLSQLQSTETPATNGLNVGGDIKDIVNSILGLPKNIIDTANKMEQGPGGINSPGGYDPLQRMLQTAKMSVAPAVGYAQNLNKDIGQPLQGGDILGRAGENFKQRPVSTILDVLPFLSAGKSALLSKFGATPEATNIAKAGELSVAKPTAPQGLLSDIKGRISTSIATPVPESVAKSEALMSDALKMTKSNTVRGMAKEMESFVPKAGEFIDSHVAAMDKTIGLQPGDQIIGQVMDKMKNSSEFLANPKYQSIIQNLLTKELESGKPFLDSARGETWGTTMAKINETRKYLNSGLSKWFDNGMPTGTPTNDLNSLKWQASQELKNILSEGDTTGLLRKAIGLQHVALQTSPSLSKAALSGSNGGYGVFKIALNALNSIITPGKISGGRALQGNSPIINQILSGESPISGASAVMR